MKAARALIAVFVLTMIQSLAIAGPGDGGGFNDDGIRQILADAPARFVAVCLFGEGDKETTMRVLQAAALEAGRQGSEFMLVPGERCDRRFTFRTLPDGNIVAAEILYGQAVEVFLQL